MNKAFEYFLWENYTSINTPLNEQHLNRLNRAIEEIDNRVIVHDMTKFNTVDAQGLIKSLVFNHENGVFTITYVNGSTATIDTMLEKLAVNFDFDEDTQQLVITLDDGTEKRVDLSAFITPIEFVDSDTIAFQLLESGEVSAIVKEGSIEEKHLRPDYLADIKVEAGKAQTSAEASATSAAASEKSASDAADSADDALKSKEDAEKSAAESAAAAESTGENVTKAENAATRAETSAAASEKSASDAADSAQSVLESERAAADSAANAAASEESVANNAKAAERNALLAKSWAVDGTGIREGEEIDNAKYYCQTAHGFRDEAEKFSQSAENAVEQINEKLKMPKFGINDDGELTVTKENPYDWAIDDDGNLRWRVKIA